MAITCPRCQAQNPDGNQFCQACGSPLAAAATTPGAPPPPPGPPAPPPSGAPAPGGFAAPPPPPPGAPGGYAPPPYYAPQPMGPQPTVHRTPWALIIGVIVGLVVLMSGCGVVVYAVARNVTPVPSAHISPAPSAAPSPVPSPTGTTRPSPSPSPTRSQPPPPSGGQTVKNQVLQLTLPAGFKVVSNDNNTIVVTDNQGLAVLIFSAGAQNPPTSAASLQQQIQSKLQARYPDTKVCINSESASLNGVTGLLVGYCFTLTPQGGQAVPTVWLVFFATNQDQSNGFAFVLAATQHDFNSEFNAFLPIINSVVWLLK